MNLHGIEFTHRNPAKQAEHVGSVYAEFSHFAELCADQGLNMAVKSVFYDTSSDCFNVDMSSVLEYTDVADAVRKCGEMSLSQFELFGAIYGKAFGGEL